MFLQQYRAFRVGNFFYLFNPDNQRRFKEEIFHKMRYKISNKSNQTIIKPTKKSTQRGAIVRDKVSAIPHPVSKLRLFSYAITENETKYEKRLRERKIQIQNLNHEYWSQINTAFNQKKKDYINNKLKNGSNQSEIDFASPQTHEELAQFYKKFLNDNHKKYIDYNFQWYRSNLSLLWPSFVVFLIRLKRRFGG